MHRSVTHKSKVAWRCRRGMKELDVLLEAYLHKRYDDSSEEYKAVFEALLELQDPALYALLTGQDSAPDRSTRNVLEAIRNAAHD